MGRCGCEMMTECDVKSGQTVESIENTRREGDKTVGDERMAVRMKRRMDGMKRV